MITLLFMTYAALCVLAFRFLRVPANTWTVSTTVLIGLVLVGGIVLLMNYNHPFTDQARIFFYTTPIFSTVSGRVVEVPVEPNVPVRKGDVLFRLDPRPFQDLVDQRRAELASVQQNVRQLKAALDEATAKLDEASASRDRARDVYDRYRKANVDARARGNPEPFTQLDEENRRGTYLESEAAAVAAHAAAERARLTYESSINGINTDVARVTAELKRAEFELSEATILAPTDGYVTELQLRPGMAAMPMPIRPVMVFVHSDRTAFAASFAQNVVQRLEPGNEAEVAFDAIPGRVFKARVKTLIAAVAQGQLQPSGDLIAPESRAEPGRAVALIDLTDGPPRQLPGGAVAQVAVYTDHWPAFGLVRRILLRMKSWMNYTPLRLASHAEACA